MNRVIKFRAWDGNRMLFTDKDQFYLIGDEVDIPSQTGHEFYRKKYPIMQFTGRPDKDGKEIYGGDILQVEHFKEGEKQHYLKHRVVWSDTYTGWMCINLDNGDDESGTLNGNTQLWCYMKDSQAEVIGNIYEHPYLLP